jgi:predicted membrane-bound spermidine synthase
MAPSRLLSVAAAIEAATGIALIIFPQAVAHLLLSAAGIAVGLVAGIALLSLGLVCWIRRRDAHQTAVVVAMLTYNSLVTAYLLSLGIGGELSEYFYGQRLRFTLC